MSPTAVTADVEPVEYMISSGPEYANVGVVRLETHGRVNLAKEEVWQ